MIQTKCKLRIYQIESTLYYRLHVMPISSSNQRLTKELFKPPPKSLVELRISQHQQFHSSGNIGLRHGLSREPHLDGTPPTKVSNIYCFESSWYDCIDMQTFLLSRSDTERNHGLIKEGGLYFGTPDQVKYTMQETLPVQATMPVMLGL